MQRSRKSLTPARGHRRLDPHLLPMMPGARAVLGLLDAGGVFIDPEPAYRHRFETFCYGPSFYVLRQAPPQYRAERAHC